MGSLDSIFINIYNMIRIIIIGITINTEKNVKNSFKEKIHKIYKILVFRNIIFFLL